MNPMPDEGVTLGELQRSVVAIRGDLKEAVNALGNRLAGLESMLIAQQATLVDKYATRREVEALIAERHQDHDRIQRKLEETTDKYISRREADELISQARTIRAQYEVRLDQVGKRMEEMADQWSTRGWVIAGSLMIALINLLVTTIGWVRTPHQ